MNLDLAAMYGTPGYEDELSAQEEGQEKVAQAELFAKLAADNGIDLNQLTDEQVEGLWEETFEEKLGADPDGDGDSDACGPDGKPLTKAQKAALAAELAKQQQAKQASAEFDEVQGTQEKFAEADYMGRVMAHAYVNELGSIGQDGSDEMDKDAGIGDAARKAWEYTRGAPRRALESTQEGGRRARDYVKAVPGRVNEGARQAAHNVRYRPWESAKYVGRKGAVPAAVAGAGAGGYAYGHHKRASAIDDFAIESAIGKVAEAGYDVDEAAQRIDAVITLGGLGVSEKIAAASNVDDAVEIRSLEVLEAAGYPVNWE